MRWSDLGWVESGIGGEGKIRENIQECGNNVEQSERRREERGM